MSGELQFYSFPELGKLLDAGVTKFIGVTREESYELTRSDKGFFTDQHGNNHTCYALTTMKLGVVSD